jgi:hypothetical protein
MADWRSLSYDALRGGIEGATTGALGGPVDLATMVLRPLGYDVEKPAGGSEWWRDKFQSLGMYGKRTGSAGEQVGEMVGAIAAPGPDPLQYASLGMMGVPMMAAMFAGKGAKTADLAKLEEAKKLTDAGSDARDIWSKTGWFKGPDDEWRFELTDDYSFLEHPEFAPKGYEKLQHPDVQDAYPEMWNSLQQSITAAPGISGQLEGGNTLIARGPTSSDRRSAALHELQHAVQAAEGFAKGDNPKQHELLNRHLRKMLDERVAADQMRRRVAHMNETPIEASEYLAKTSPGLEAEAIRLLELSYPGGDLSKSIADIESRYKASDPMQLYRRSAGEAEARAVQKRMNMTAAERAKSFPLDSYDVPPDQLIVRR